MSKHEQGPKLPPVDPRKKFHPESLMMTYGYKPELSEGALKPPIFQTSTFVFESAEEGKAFFEVAYGLRERGPTEELGLIYSRLNNPNLEIVENRLSIWEGAQDTAVFSSGLAAISTVMLEFLRPGDVLLHSRPIYGGADYVVNHILPRYGIEPVAFGPGEGRDAILARLGDRLPRLGAVYAETPANPTNALFDIGMCAEIAAAAPRDEKPLVIIDNTYLGPLWQHPLKLGADLTVFSATKYVGGHSDVIAGGVSGGLPHLKRVKAARTFFGCMLEPFTGWLLARSLETLKLRMDRQLSNAGHVADFLATHPKVACVHYLGHLTEADAAYAIYRRQCLAPGAMISFELKGGEAECFRFLNALRLVKLAVSLGSTESLAEHPATMTHSDIAPAAQLEMGITPAMVRLSVGVEHADDLIWDLNQALEGV